MFYSSLHTSSLCSQAKFTVAHRQLVGTFADTLRDNPGKAADLRLAAELASGKLHNQSALYALIRLLGNRAKQLSRGAKKLTATTLPGLTEEMTNDVGFHLSAHCRNNQSMAEFGRYPQSKPPLDFSHPTLPICFMSFAKSALLRQEAKKCLRQLNCLWTRNYMVLHDETNFAPGFGYLGYLLVQKPPRPCPHIEECQDKTQVIQSDFTLFCGLPKKQFSLV